MNNGGNVEKSRERGVAVWLPSLEIWDEGDAGGEAASVAMILGD
jgi:hypothetical protein